MNGSASLYGSIAPPAPAGVAGLDPCRRPPARRAWRRAAAAACAGAWSPRGLAARLGGGRLRGAAAGCSWRWCAWSARPRRSTRPAFAGRFVLVLATRRAPSLDAVLAGLAAFLASLTDRRLSGPRTGERSMNTQPTWGTGLPPTSRPWSNSQPYWPWNSWNESLDSTTASTRSAICNRNASPRPITPAGGVSSSPAPSASSNAARSLSSMRFGKLASTMTVTFSGLYSSRYAAHCLVELTKARQGATLGREVRSVDDDVLDGHPVSKSTSCAHCTGGCCNRSRDLNSPLCARVWSRTQRCARQRATREVRTRSVVAMTNEVTDLLQHLIRNACVNDGTRALRSGGAERGPARTRTSKVTVSTSSATKPRPGERASSHASKAPIRPRRRCC